LALIDLLDPDRNFSKFNFNQQKLYNKLKKAIQEQGLPDGFINDEVHIRREQLSGKVYISNKTEQMCMFNNDKLEIYYRCPKCMNEGFKNTLVHSSRCDAMLC
jgi:hypothetical protein